MDVVSVVSPTDSDGIISSYLRATRHNRTLYVIKGNLTCRPPLTEQQNEYKVSNRFNRWHLICFNIFLCIIQIRTDIYFSSSGNSQYTLTAYRLPERFFCEFLNTDYRKFIMPALVGTSTAPVTDDEQEDFCENLFKSTSEEVKLIHIFYAFQIKNLLIFFYCLAFLRDIQSIFRQIHHSGRLASRIL